MKKYSRKVAETALLAGQILLESNAESYRVEDTMNFILNSSNLKNCEAYTMTTGLFLSIDDPSLETITLVKRVTQRRINLSRIVKVNNISRQIANEKMDIYTAYDKLKKISVHRYNNHLEDIALMVMCAAFAAVLGGGLIEVVIAFIVSSFLPIFNHFNKDLDLGDFITNSLAIVPMVFIIIILKDKVFLNLNEQVTIIGVIRPTLPGTAITNAIRDTFHGNYNSGSARMMEAFMKAFSVSVGVALGLLFAGGLR